MTRSIVILVIGLALLALAVGWFWPR